MTTRIKLRRDTASNWAGTNPVLALGEPGFDTTNRVLKIGNGTTAWNSLDPVSGGATVGEFQSDWQDGINDNVWRFTTVTGTKEFDFVTEGYKDVVLTTTSGQTDATSVTFATTDFPALTDFLWNTSENVSNSWVLYIGEDMQTQLSNYAYTQSGNDVTFTFDTVTWNLGDKFVIKYWSEGTVYQDTDYDDYDGNWVLEDALNTNSVTLSTSEFNPWAPWSDLLENIGKHSIVFKNYTSNITRAITAVTDNNDGTFTITFNGDPLDVKTVSLETISNAAVTNSGTDSTYFTISKNSYPEFGAQVIRGWWGSQSNVLTGGTQRSGYIVIDGGEPVNFSYYNNQDGTTGDWVLDLQATATWTPDSTVTVYWYRDYGNIRLNIFNQLDPNNWNNGYQWFDWKEDMPEYSPVPGNAIHGGKGTVLFKVYDQESDNAESMSTNFGWNGHGYDERWPTDPYRQESIDNIYFDNHQPFDRFNLEGIAFNSDNKLNGDYSKRLKVRVMYKFELIIGEEGYWWFDC